MKAQTLVGKVNDELVGIIPSCFSASGHPYLIYWMDHDDGNLYLSLYKSDFTTHLTDIRFDVHDQEHVIEPEYIDLDAFSEELELVFTQTLFNDDEYFEYFTTEGENKTIRVKSTNGSTIWTYTAEEDATCTLESLFKYDNDYYLIIRTNSETQGRKYLLYLIKQGQGVDKVDTPLPLSVYPTLLRHNQQITVELGEGNNAKEITVVNSLGQVVKRVPVADGQRTVNIPTSELGTSLNIVNTRTLKGQGSCKIIVQ